MLLSRPSCLLLSLSITTPRGVRMEGNELPDDSPVVQWYLHSFLGAPPYSELGISDGQLQCAYNTCSAVLRKSSRTNCIKLETSRESRLPECRESEDSLDSREARAGAAAEPGCAPLTAASKPGEWFRLSKVGESVFSESDYCNLFLCFVSAAVGHAAILYDGYHAVSDEELWSALEPSDDHNDLRRGYSNSVERAAFGAAYNPALFEEDDGRCAAADALKERLLCLETQRRPEDCLRESKKREQSPKLVRLSFRQLVTTQGVGRGLWNWAMEQLAPLKQGQTTDQPLNPFLSSVFEFLEPDAEDAPVEELQEQKRQVSENPQLKLLKRTALMAEGGEDFNSFLGKDIVNTVTIRGRVEKVVQLKGYRAVESIFEQFYALEIGTMSDLFDLTMGQCRHTPQHHGVTVAQWFAALFAPVGEWVHFGGNQWEPRRPAPLAPGGDASQRHQLLVERALWVENGQTYVRKIKLANSSAHPDALIQTAHERAMRCPFRKRLSSAESKYLQFYRPADDGFANPPHPLKFNDVPFGFYEYQRDRWLGLMNLVLRKSGTSEEIVDKIMRMLALQMDFYGPFEVF